VAYALQVETLERHWAIEFQAAVAVRVAGGTCEVPAFADRLEGWEMALRSVPQETDPRRGLMRRALGLD
jgi:hypothetical protein